MKRSIAIILIIVISLGAFSGCQPREPQSLRIALQYGLAYAPLIVAKEKGMIEANLSDKTVTWLQLANSAAIRESMLAGELDVGYMGIPPFLIAYDKGVDWQIFSGLSQAPLALMSNDQTIETLADFTAEQRIATPQPGSIQHILLMMAAQRELGDAHYFDDQLASLKHPDALTMLLSSDQIVAHFASPPYVFMEGDAGMKSVLDGRTAFGGDFSFIVGVAYRPGRADDQDLAAIRAALIEANRFIDQNRDETVAILGQYFDVDAAVLSDYLYQTDMVYGNDIEGTQIFIDFMRAVGYLTTQFDEREVIR